MEKMWLERFAETVLRGAIALGSLFAAPIVFFVGLIEKAVVYVRDLARRLRPEDPFFLRRNGDTLLSNAVKLDLAAYTSLLVLSLTFELFAWGSMWSYIGDTVQSGFWGVVLALVLALIPFAFALMVILLDRGILIMDDPNGGKRTRVILARASMLFLLALITAVPVELRVFKPEIDRVVEDAEKAQVDAIRETARGYETKLAEGQKATSAVFVTGQPDDVVARRKEERVALVLQQRADRTEISKRLEKKGTEAAREAAGKGVSGRHGAGVATAVMRGQEKETRQELKDYDKAAREQLTAFDAETERMRSEAAQNGVEEIARRDTALTEKLHEVEVMSAEELAAAYGGEYKQANGFLARYRILLTLVEEDGKNQAIVWGCRLVMVLFGLCVLFVKFVMVSPETAAYYSLRAQALSGNKDAVRVYIAKALASKDAEALEVLRAVAREDADAKATLEKLGYGGNVEMAGYSEEVYALHGNLREARVSANVAYALYTQAFRDLCAERGTDGRFGHTRAELVRRARADWIRIAQKAIFNLADAERVMVTRGVRVSAWPNELVEGDPRAKPVLWELSDDVLEREWGWVKPVDALFRNAPSA